MKVISLHSIKFFDHSFYIEMCTYIQSSSGKRKYLKFICPTQQHQKITKVRWWFIDHLLHKRRWASTEPMLVLSSATFFLDRFILDSYNKPWKDSGNGILVTDSFSTESSIIVRGGQLDRSKFPMKMYEMLMVPNIPHCRIQKRKLYINLN